jgi:hypothetical protein
MFDKALNVDAALQRLGQAILGGGLPVLEYLCLQESYDSRTSFAPLFRALGGDGIIQQGCCPRLEHLLVSHLDKDNDALALAEMLESRQALGMPGLKELSASYGYGWWDSHPDACHRIFRVVLPTMLKAFPNWHPNIFDIFAETVLQHPAAVLPLQEGTFMRRDNSYDPYFEFLPMAQALRLGKMPHLRKLEIDTKFSQEALQILAFAIEEGRLSRLVELCFVAREIDSDSLLLLMQAFGRAPQHTQNLDKLIVSSVSSDWPHPSVLDAFHASLQQHGAFPRLKSLRMVGWNARDAQTKEALEKCKQAMEERGGEFFWK